ncbi:MFS transporter [Lentzea sp. NPDC042327]|uniref:MFS transporter n=1 Tax=Lentzea sp. NPDC042327 TaxID=3154801 RepID=UPI0033DF7D37
MLADIVSTLGDQLARVALALLVFDRTGSAWWTAAVYALTFLPDLIGLLTLAWVADYYPRRSVIVVCSLVQGASFTLMAIPGAPLWTVAVLVAVSTVALAPSKAAQMALVTDVLPQDLLPVGQGLLGQARSIGQVVGLSGGGALVAAIGPSPVLVLNAATFVIASVLVARGVPDLPAPGGARRPGVQWRTTFAVLRGDRQLLTLIALAWMATIVVIPDGVVAPLAEEIGGGRSSVGLLLAVHPLTYFLALFLLAGRFVRRRQNQVMWMLALLAVAPLTGFFLRPSLAAALVLLALSGVGTAYQAILQAEVMSRVPTHVRGSAGGFVRSGLRVGQGVGVALAGAAAELTGSTTLTLGAAGLVGCCWVAAAGFTWRRAAATAPR